MLQGYKHMTTLLPQKFEVISHCKNNYLGVAPEVAHQMPEVALATLANPLVPLLVKSKIIRIQDIRDINKFCDGIWDKDTVHKD